MPLKKYRAAISPAALEHLQNDISYYNSKSKGLGIKYFEQYKKAEKQLRRNPFLQIQYHNIRCFMIPKFQHRIHFEVEERSRVIYILAILHTSRNPVNRR